MEKTKEIPKPARAAVAMRPMVVKGKFVPDTITADFTRRSSYEWVPFEKFRIEAYQRTHQKDEISKIAHKWENDLLGTPVVSFRDDGFYYIVDGQKRYKAMSRIQNHPTHIYCEVFRGLTIEEEAYLYTKLDSERSNLAPKDSFRGYLWHKDPAATAIKEAADEEGFNVDPDKNAANNLRAFKTLRQIYNRTGRAGFQRILRIARNAWPDRKDAGAEPILRGLEVFLTRYPDADDSRLINVLSLTNPMMLISTARRIKEDLSSTIYPAVGQTIRGLYNKRLIHKLGDWR